MNQTDTSHEPLPPQNTPLVTLTFLHLLFVGVGVLVVANIVNYSLGTPFWLITQLIHLGSDNNIPAWYSSGLLAIGGVVAFDCFRLAKARAVTGAWAFALMAATLLFMSCDEIARLHELVGGHLVKSLGLSSHSFAQHAGWVWIGGPVVVGLFSALFLLLRKPLSLVGGSGRLLTLGFGMIILGGVVLESSINWLNHNELQWLWNIEIVLEEGLEMFGSLLLAYAFAVWNTSMSACSPLAGAAA